MNHESANLSLKQSNSERQLLLVSMVLEVFGAAVVLNHLTVCWQRRNTRLSLTAGLCGWPGILSSCRLFGSWTGLETGPRSSADSGSPSTRWGSWPGCSVCVGTTASFGGHCRRDCSRSWAPPSLPSPPERRSAQRCNSARGLWAQSVQVTVQIKSEFSQFQEFI